MRAAWTGPAHGTLVPSVPHPDDPPGRTDIFTGSSAEGSGLRGQCLCTRPATISTCWRCTVAGRPGAPSWARSEWVPGAQVS